MRARLQGVDFSINEGVEMNFGELEVPLGGEGWEDGGALSLDEVGRDGFSIHFLFLFYFGFHDFLLCQVFQIFKRESA